MAYEPDPSDLYQDPRRVLMIAHAFPPTGGPGVQRPAKFAKYLPQFGWLPTVWTADQVDGLPRDPTLRGELPNEVAVHACGSGSGILALRRSLRGFANARNGEGLTGVASRFAKAVDWRLEAWHVANTLPDDCAAWARRSVQPLLRLIRKEGIDVIYSTFSPASNHVLALELKRRTRLPWIAEFRDLWTDDCRYRESSARRRAAHRRLEQETLETANVVIGVGERQTQILAGHVPTQRDKFITITNGFDPADFPQRPPGRRGRPEEFVLAYVGRFDLTRTVPAVFGGLRRFADGLGADLERCVFRIVGHATQIALDQVAETGVPCEFSGEVPHAEAIDAMRSADALLLTAPGGTNGETVICAKVFEYLAARRPIVLVGPPDGECERIVRSCNAGLSAPFDEAAVADALLKVFRAWRSGRPLSGCRGDRLNAYDRFELTRRLAEALDGLLDSTTASGQRAGATMEAFAP